MLTYRPMICMGSKEILELNKSIETGKSHSYYALLYYCPPQLVNKGCEYVSTMQFDTTIIIQHSTETFMSICL